MFQRFFWIFSFLIIFKLTFNLRMIFFRSNLKILIPRRFYTCIVEREVKPNIVKQSVDVRKVKLKAVHYQYKLKDCLHNKKWGDVELLLTEYIEGTKSKFYKREFLFLFDKLFIY